MPIDKKILTTHVGSLIRPPELREFIAKKQNGLPFDRSLYEKTLTDSVATVVKRQVEAGIDIPSDGEFGKGISWSQYVLERMSGFIRRPAKPGEHGFARGADRARFADFYKELDAADGPPAAVNARTVVELSVTMSGAFRSPGTVSVSLPADGAHAVAVPPLFVSVPAVVS